ncbi:MAG: sugar phosphate isomerase/epimerase family protein [Candidatus Acidiferrales bacterium]|jgi:sugar phosphate isomerase/epimerase
MQHILSTYLFVQRKLTPELLAQIAAAKFVGVEVFCSRAHFDYASPEAVRELGQSLADKKLFLHALHSPASRDRGPTREGGTPLSICEVERVRRIDAMDEIKRALDVAEFVPFRYFVQHVGASREEPDPRRLDAAFSSLEHLSLHARNAGVTIVLENTLSEMGTPAHLRTFVNETRLTGLKFCFDVGHANLADGPAEGKLSRSFEPMRELSVTSHVHDNHGEKDEHLLPYEGTLDWAEAARLFVTAPQKELPLVLELREPAAHAAAEPPAAAELLEAARKALDKLEKEMNRAG